MAGYRRRKRRTGLWLPVLGQSFEQSEGETYYDGSHNFTLLPVNNHNADGPIVEVHPIVKDATQTPEAVFGDTASTFRDLVNGQDWTCQRIVGKFHARVYPSQSQDTNDSNEYWAFLKVSLGFFVARASDDEQAQPDLYTNEFDPNQLNNVDNPWMFRRTWILKNPQTYVTPELFSNDSDFPQTTAGYGSVLDGPHIDVKSKRRIKRDERLWCVIAAAGFNGTQITTSVAEGQQPNLRGNLDLRVYGGLRRPMKSAQF